MKMTGKKKLSKQFKSQAKAIKDLTIGSWEAASEYERLAVANHKLQNEACKLLTELSLLERANANVEVVEENNGHKLVITQIINDLQDEYDLALGSCTKLSGDSAMAGTQALQHSESYAYGIYRALERVLQIVGIPTFPESSQTVNGPLQANGQDQSSSPGSIKVSSGSIEETPARDSGDGWSRIGAAVGRHTGW